MTDEQPILKAIEMSMDASARFARGETLLSDRPESEFFHWLIQMNAFDCAVVLPKRSLLQQVFRGQQLAWPQVTTCPDELKRARPIFEETALSGFRLIVGVKSGIDELVAFFARLGYRLEGRGVYGSADQHDPTSATWNRAALQQGVQVASKLCQSPLCVFAHDADPVYLLHRN
jgi:hypothetical protein